MPTFGHVTKLFLQSEFQNKENKNTPKCLSIGTPKNNEISICSKSKIDYFWMSQNLDPLQPNYNVLKYCNI